MKDFSKAKPTTWIRDGFTDQEVENIVTEARDCVKELKSQWPLNTGNYILSNNTRPCCVCGRLTNYVEINYESFVCSQECEAVLDKEYQDWLAKTPEINFKWRI